MADPTDHPFAEAVMARWREMMQASYEQAVQELYTDGMQLKAIHDSILVEVPEPGQRLTEGL